MPSQKNNSEMAKQKLHNESHKHQLELKNYEKPYTCDGCKENGFGPRYRCKNCDYDLHKECMEITASTSHEFFPNSTFSFLTSPPKACHNHCKRQCDACRKPINGFVYHCKKHNLDLHPFCRHLARRQTMGGEEKEENEIILHKNVKKNCLWCNKKSLKEGDHSNGWSYISKCEVYHIHVACVIEMILEKWKEKSDTMNKINNNVMKDNHISLALHKVNFREIQAKRNGNGKTGIKYKRILQVFIKTIASILFGDPTSLFLEFVSLG